MTPKIITPSGNDFPPDEYKNEVPWWVAPLYKFGIPAGIALGLVWFLAVKVQTKLDAIEATVNNQQTIMIQNAIVNKDILKLLQRICSNSATTNQERNGCFQ